MLLTRHSDFFTVLPIAGDTMKRSLFFLCGGCSFLLLCFVPSASHSSKPATKPAKSSQVVASIHRRGVVDCFAKGMVRVKKGKKQPMTCEVSGVAYDGKRLLFVSDKKMPHPGHSSTFSIPYRGPNLSTQGLKYWLQPVLKQANKLEDLSVSPDGKHLFATSAFDRILPSGKWDGYNSLLYWKIGEDRVKQLQASRRNPKTQTIPLRECIKSALTSSEYPRGAPFFKVEGLAAIPGNTLLFGVREWGASYWMFGYSIQVVAVKYRFQKGRLLLEKSCKRVFNASLRMSKVVRKRVALSSLEYDRYRKRLYLLTSFETSDTARGLGGYLWTLRVQDLMRNRPARLVRTPQGKPLLFAHKAEGLTVIDKNTLLVVHDDDRVLGKKPVRDPTREFYREHHQMAYTVVKWRSN